MFTLNPADTEVMQKSQWSDTNKLLIKEFMLVLIPLLFQIVLPSHFVP